KFGRQYNEIRIEYGSPIIHDYLELESTSDDYECWGISRKIHDTIRIGFHEGKCFHIAKDSTLYEDDIFRKRINDSTYVFIGILTYGNRRDHKYEAIYYDTADARSLNVPAAKYLNNNNDYMKYYESGKMDLTIEQADSILAEWGTSRTE
ncbi:MAG: hypothetical protein AAFN93_06705, partial [Bacteroidota bacterium]